MIVECNNAGIKTASNVIRNGGIAVYPTDTVYGVGCDPYNIYAIKKIFRLKKRASRKQLPILGFSKYEISKIALFDKLSSRIAEKIWPGPLTLILKIKDQKIKKSLGLDEKIAVRVPNNECVLSLLKKCELIVGTSANISQKPSSSDPKIVMQNFSGYDVFLDGGKITSFGESTVLEVIDDEIKIIRKGTLSSQAINDLI